MTLQVYTDPHSVEVMPISCGLAPTAKLARFMRNEEAMCLRGKLFLLILLLMLGAASCATYKQPRINIRPVDEYPNISTTQGISVAADPYGTTEKAKEGFRADVTRKGFFPVNLIFKNDTNECVRIRRETIELIDENGVVHRPVNSKVMFENLKFSAVARFIAGSVISVVVGAVSSVSAILANRKMKADWGQKEIPDELIIPPGRNMSGFVYFRLPEGETTTVSKLCVESVRVDSGEKIRFELLPRENESSITISPIKRSQPVEHSLTGSHP